MLTLVYFALRHGDLSSLLRALGHGDTLFHDFKAFFLPMGEAFWSDARSERPFVYGPLAGFGFACLAWLPSDVATACWAVATIAATIGLALVPRLAWPKVATTHALGVFALTIGAYPALHNLRFGQVSALLCLLSIGAGWAQHTGHSRRAGILLGLATSLKFYPALLALGFFVARDRKALTWFAGTSVVGLVVFPAALLGSSGVYGFYEHIYAEISSRFGSGISDPNSQGLSSFLHRFGHHHALLWLVDYETYIRAPIVVSWLGLCVWIIARKNPRQRPLEGWTGLLLATPLVVATSWPHYFMYLPFCAFVVWQVLEASDAGRRSALVGRVLLLVGVLLVWMPTFDFVADRIVYVRNALVLFANFCVMAALVLAQFGVARPAGSIRVESPRFGIPAWSLAFVGVVAVQVLAHIHSEPYDDAYFFVRFARNFVDGHGFCWNPIDGPVYGNTSQMFQALVAGIHAVFGDYTVVATRVLSGLALVITLAHMLPPGASAQRVAPLMLTFSSPMLLAPLNSGMETSLTACALLPLARFAAIERSPSPRRLRLVAALGVVLFTLRPDTLILSAGVLAFAPSKSLRERIIALAWLAAGVSMVMGTCTLYYGTPLPTAFFLKNTSTTLYGPHFLELSRVEKVNHVGFAALHFAPLIYLGLGAQARCRTLILRVGLPAAVFCAYHIFATTEVMGMHARYYLPALVFVAGALAADANSPVETGHRGRDMVFLGIWCGALLTAFLLGRLPDESGWPVGRTPPWHYAAMALGWIGYFVARERQHPFVLSAALCGIALTLAIENPMPRLRGVPTDDDYVGQSKRHVRSYRGLDQLQRCLGSQVHVYHSEIGTIGMQLREARITDLGGIMSPRLIHDHAGFESMCREDRPDAIFLPHRNYRAFNAEIAGGECIRGYRKVMHHSSSPLYVRADHWDAFHCD